jgi:NAD(P)-dependent dehydrogenase (short-subunit alcohol dehydrogenase family)
MKGQVVLVTGGTRGIGAAIARDLVARGHRVFVTSRTGRGRAPAEEVEILPLDQRDAGSVAACVAMVAERAGTLDVLVNNAGYDLYGALEDTSWDEFMDQIDTNFLGVVRMTKAVLPAFRERGRGRIVTIGSLGGRIGLPLNGAYAASKFAVEGVMESLRLEMRPFGVEVSLIVPAAVATETLATSIAQVTRPSAPYAARLRAMVARMRKDGEGSPVRPEDVAHAVRRAVEDSRPAPVYTVGAQAGWVPRMKALLPGRSFDRTMQRLFPAE